MELLATHGEIIFIFYKFQATRFEMQVFTHLVQATVRIQQDKVRISLPITCLAQWQLNFQFLP